VRIAILGLGIIGSIWSRHFRADGHDVRSWNRTPRPDFPGWTEDLTKAVAGADLVAIVVSDGAAVLDVLEQALPATPKNAIVAVHSTISPSDILSAARRTTEAGMHFLEMPFTGSATASENRQVVFYIGGSQDTLEFVRPLYRAIARQLIPTGAWGSAAALKLSMNLMIADIYQSLAEGFHLASSHGIAPELFFTALSLNVAQSGVAQLKRDKMVSGDYSPHFSVKHMHKDLRLALDLAKEHHLNLATTQTVEKAYTSAEEQGWRDLDFSALAQLVQPPPQARPSS
jgi:3-hydroxyisobutyrate dehydrogenase-like beta-hydroxyacid dehydrogenase